MGSRLHAPYYADAAMQRDVAIVENVAVATDTYRVRLHCTEIAERVIPGQFLMVRIADCNDPLIGRALAVYNVLPDSSGCSTVIDLIYHVKGKFTTYLKRSPPGQQLGVWGPLGNGFPPLECQHLIMVAGGVGQTPFLTLAREHLGLQQFGSPPRHVRPLSRVTLCFGAESEKFLGGVEDFRRLGIDVRLATIDGSTGHHGPVTELLAHELDKNAREVKVASCGPAAMMKESARIAANSRVPCYVSLETPMACGIGICFTCVAKIRDTAGHWDYKRTCVEGPVFDATRVSWD